MVEFRLLGSLIVAKAGESIVVPRGLQARILVALAVNQSRPVTDDALIDICWPSNQVATAMSSMRNSIARLRAVLGADAIVRESSGYRLGSNVQTDLYSFESLFAEAVRNREERPRSALASIAEAMALARGRPLADFADELWAIAFATHWTERIAAAGDLFADLAAITHDSTAIPVILELARDRPERELRWLAAAQLLRSCGRRVEALRVVNEARRELRQFGVDPSEQLADMEHALLADNQCTSAPFVDRRRRPDDFVGRNDLIELINRALVDAHVVTLTGLGGVGKTRLALELARRSDREDGVVIVDLTHASADIDFMRELARGADIALEETAADAILRRVGGVFSATSNLIVVDNADRHREIVRDALDSLASYLRSSRVIVTSRLSVGCRGECVVHVPPLATPAAEAGLDEVRRSPAVELFVQRARLGPISERSYRLVSDIVLAVAGNCFAVQLCASLTDVLPLDELHRGLTGGGGLLETVHQSSGTATLEAVFEHVVDQLGGEDSRVYACLGVFHAPFTADSAQAILGVEAPKLLFSLSRLVHASLIHVHTGDPTTYYLDDLQAAMARRLLDERGETSAITARFEAHYVAFAQSHAPSLRTAGQRTTIALITAEIGNLRYLLERADPPLSAHDGLLLAGSLGEYWFLSGQWTDGLRFIDASLSRSSDHRSEAHAVALAARPRAGGVLATVLSSAEQMRDGIDMAEEARRPDLVDEMTVWEGLALMAQGQIGEGLDSLQQIARSSGASPWAAAQARMVLGLASAVAGSMERACEQCSISASGFLALGDELNAANTLKNLGMTLVRHGHGETARAYLERAVTLAAGVMPALDAQAKCALAELDADRGVVNISELRTLRNQLFKLGDLSGSSAVDRLLARAEVTRGDTQAALRHLQNGLLDLAAHEEQASGLVMLDIAELSRDQGLTESVLLFEAAWLLESGPGYGWRGSDRSRLPADRPGHITAEERLAVVHHAIHTALSLRLTGA